MELAATMPSHLKVRDGSKKWILKELFQSRLPQQLAHRKKQGFELPTDDWLRGPLKGQVHEVILNRNAPIATYINTDQAARMYRSHCNHTGRFGQVLWSLLVLGRWLDTYGGSSGSMNRVENETTSNQLRDPLTQTT